MTAPESPERLRTVAISHSSEPSGPAYSLYSRLAWLAEQGSLEVLLPRDGKLRELYAPLAKTNVLAYGRVTVLSSPRELLGAARAFHRDVRLFRSYLGATRPGLAIVMTTHLPAALVAARLEEVPVISYVGEIFEKGHARSLGRAAGGRLLAFYVERLSDALICCSRTVASQFRGSERTIVATAYPPIDARYAAGDGDAFRRRHRLEGAHPLVAVVGNITAGRGQDLVVRALAAIRQELPEAMAVIAGEAHTEEKDEPFRRQVVSLVEDLQLTDSVVLPGFVDPIADLYAAADIVVNPARFNEPFGRVAFESMTAGRPVVATTVGAIPEVLRDDCDALLVPPNDPAPIATSVIRLARDRALRERLVEAGRRRVATELTEERALEQFRQITRQVLDRRNRRSATHRA